MGEVRKLTFEEEVSVMVSTMHAGLTTYGKHCDASLLESWLLVLSARGVRQVDLAPVSLDFLAAGGDMPNPGEFAREAKAREGAEYMSQMMECVDESGVSYVAHRSQVRDGRLVKNGQGNGLPAPNVPALEAPMPIARRVASMSDEALVTFACLTGHPDAVSEVARRGLKMEREESRHPVRLNAGETGS